MVQQGCDFVGTPQLNLDEWAALLRCHMQQSKRERQSNHGQEEFGVERRNRAGGR